MACFAFAERREAASIFALRRRTSGRTRCGCAASSCQPLRNNETKYLATARRSRLASPAASTLTVGQDPPPQVARPRCSAALHPPRSKCYAAPLPKLLAAGRWTCLGRAPSYSTTYGHPSPLPPRVSVGLSDSCVAAARSCCVAGTSLRRYLSRCSHHTPVDRRFSQRSSRPIAV